jgi:pimeloyl-ACP methyl ester carboxylesterase
VALENPELVAGLVVSGVGRSEPEFTDPWVLDLFAEWKAAEGARDAQRWLNAFLRFASGPCRPLDDVDPDVVDRLRRMGWDTLQHHAVRSLVPPTTVTRTWERASSITLPVVAVSGTLDSPDHIGMAHRLAWIVPDARVVDIPKAAHYPNMEQPAAFDWVLADATG